MAMLVNSLPALIKSTEELSWHSLSKEGPSEMDLGQAPGKLMKGMDPRRQERVTRVDNSINATGLPIASPHLFYFSFLLSQKLFFLLSFS